MKNLTRSLAWAVGLLTTATAGAQFVNPPIIIPTNLDRSVIAEAAADGNFCDRDEILNSETGLFPASVSMTCSGPLGSNATGTAEQLTWISPYSIGGTGSVSANATVGSHENAWVGLNVWTLTSVSFAVPVDAVLWLRGSFDVTEVNDTNGTCGEDTEVWVFLAGTDANGTSGVFDRRFHCDDPPEQEVFEHFNTLKANTPVTFFVLASSGLGTEFDPAARLGQRTASFDFDFDVGICPDPCVPPDPNNPPGPGDPNWDFDRDGLIDGWEIDGIDFDGDGTPEIDLPGLGAVAGTRDIFVEVDIMEGVTFDQTAIDDVIQAFAEAPPAFPGGSPGINLNVLVDTDQPAQVQLQVLNNELPPEYYIIKGAFFGTEQDRMHPDWDQIRPVRLGIFRYSLWADTLLKESGGHLWGRAESIPSNDFVLAAGRMQSALSIANVLTDALAGVWMHELGHTLDLRHGGQEDSPNYKPNYLSVMNYAYGAPMDLVTNQGTNATEAWRLDYSRTELQSLDENQLVESDGLNGPPGRMILFNSALEGSSSTINIGWAMASEVDWNNNSTTDAAPYARDISNITDADASYDILDSFTDWDRLRIESSGSSDFDDRKPWPYAKRVIEEGFEEDIYLAILNAEWVDQTALGDLVFENGFELGSTTAWSETVP